jgi:PAS domain S-box-containing protein
VDHLINRRDRIDVIADILAVSISGATKTKIVYDCNINFVLATNYLEFLTKKKLLTKSENNKKVFYKTTPDKGAVFLSVYERLNSLCKENYKSLFSKRTLLPPNKIDSDSSAKQPFSSFIDKITEPVLIVDLNGVIVAINAAEIAFLGYGKDELVGQHFCDLGHIISRQDTIKCLRMLQAFSLGEKVHRVNVNIKPKSGHKILVEVNAFLMQDDEPQFLLLQTALSQRPTVKSFDLQTFVKFSSSDDIVLDTIAICRKPDFSKDSLY